jgi:hypothetical protein
MRGDVLDDIQNHPREVGYRYFVRGDVKPKMRRHVPTDFGDGIYAWDDNAEGLVSSEAWATRKAALLAGSAIAVVQLIRASVADLQNMRCLDLKAGSGQPGSEWDRAVQWYRQRDAGNGPLEDYDLVSGPQATRKGGKWRPAIQIQDQYRFLPRVERYIQLVREVELE